MNELMTNKANDIIQRTPDLIAAEINNIKDQTRKMVLYNSIEIGRRLVEAKALVQHGEWGEWLKKSVDYSQRTASNLMRIFEEYGANQITLLGDNSNSQAIANLSYTQAVALLGVPHEEREAFIEENDVENLSTRELQKAIKEREEAIKEKEELEEKLKIVTKEAETNKHLHETVQKSYKRLEKANTDHFNKSVVLEKELEELTEKLAEAKRSGNNEEVEALQFKLKAWEDELKKAKEKAEDLERQLKEKPIDINAETIVEKVPEEIEKELQELREKVNQNTEVSEPVLKFSIYFNELVKTFKDLLNALGEIEDKEANEKYTKAVYGLIDKMNERL